MVATLVTDGITKNRLTGTKDHIRERRETSPGLDCTPLPPKRTGGRGLKSVEMEYKQTKVKAAVKLYSNNDRTLKLVREFEEHASMKGYKSLVKEAQCYANEMGISLDLSHLQPVCKDRDGKDISCEKVKNELIKVAAKEICQDKMRN